MAYDPSMYENRRRSLMSNYATTGAQNVYQQFLDAQRQQRQFADLNTQFEKAAPKVVSQYGRRGLVGPNVKSGAFRKAMSDFAKSRAKQTGEAQREMQQSNLGFDVQQRQRDEMFQNDLRDLEMEKARQIEQDAMELLRYRAGA
jgi:hypothetical protein